MIVFLIVVPFGSVGARLVWLQGFQYRDYQIREQSRRWTVRFLPSRRGRILSRHGEVLAQDNVGKVSIVGTGIQSAPGYAARMFRTLSEAGVNMEMISTSEIRITCIMIDTDVEKVVRAVHAAFEMEKAEASEL